MVVLVDVLTAVMPVDHCIGSIVQSRRTVNQNINHPSIETSFPRQDIRIHTSRYLRVRLAQRDKPDVRQHLSMHSDSISVGQVASWTLLQYWAESDLRERVQRRFGFLHPRLAIISLMEAASISNQKDAVVRHLSCWDIVSTASCFV